MGNLLASCLPLFNKENDDSFSSMPTEVIIEILTYMPTKSLARFQLVCKEWQSIIHDHHFTEKHIDRGEVIRHWFNIIPTARMTYQELLPEVLRVRSHCGVDGLLLIEILNTHKICIWNPATCRLLELPDAHADRYGFAFSYIPATKNYRVVSVYKDKISGRECCEVCTPGHSKTWRRLMFPDNVNWPTPIEGKRVSIISSRGVVHCLYSDEIVSFDIGTESFVLNFVPKSSLFEDWTKGCAVDWNGKLAFAYIKGEHLGVMELEDYRKQRWSKKKKVSHLPFINEYGYETSKLLTVSAKEGDIWFWLKGKKIFSYTIETGLINSVCPSNRFIFQNRHIHPFKSSLVNFEGMQPQDPRLEYFRPHKLTKTCLLEVLLTFICCPCSFFDDEEF